MPEANKVTTCKEFVGLPSCDWFPDEAGQYGGPYLTAELTCDGARRSNTRPHLAAARAAAHPAALASQVRRRVCRRVP